jgi:hypothetical protein
MNEAWTWLLNFTGVNNGDNSFATHMYNFWSGFGGSISIFALLGAVVGLYRHNLKRIETLKAVEMFKQPLNIMQKKIEDEHNKHK